MKKISLLILTQYFPPEVGAPQNRLFELALRLQKLNVDITVLTAMPNYPQMKIYEGYENKKYYYEEISGIPVHRASIYIPKKKSIIQRLLNYFSFVYNAARVGKKKLNNFDFILCESPPLFLGWAAMFLARRKKAKLIFNVSDLWPESAEKLGVVTNKFLLKLAYNLEAKLYRKSVLVTGQTQGICKDINSRFPSVKTYWLPNGVDLEYYKPSSENLNKWREKYGFYTSDIVFLYAGIIGLAQGLEVILHAAEKLRENNKIKFVLLGSGPEKPRLEKLKFDLKLENVYFFDAVTKAEMPEIIAASDASIIPLKKMDLFLGAIPSKIFENLSMEKPIILGVDGEARDLFIKKGNCGLYFEPENHSELAQCCLTLASNNMLRKSLGENGRNFVKENFNRNNIAENFRMQLDKLAVNGKD